ncbi:transcriptional regulator [Lacrimispora amygdalina]|uniref:Transcriptional regulator n=1 Tax=Lacrimispora amygdalina TaxID=253257 RepID=A0ABQ5M7N8_9FIRM
MYEIFVKLLDERGVTAYKVSKATGIAGSTFTDWKTGRSTPKQDKLQKIADYFGVSIEYLMTGVEGSTKEEAELNSRDKRDIAKDLDRIMNEIRNEEGGPLFYNGQPLDPEDMIFLSKAIEAALTDAKKKNKVTFNPNKNKTKK